MIQLYSNSIEVVSTSTVIKISFSERKINYIVYGDRASKEKLLKTILYGANVDKLSLLTCHRTLINRDDLYVQINSLPMRLFTDIFINSTYQNVESFIDNKKQNVCYCDTFMHMYMKNFINFNVIRQLMRYTTDISIINSIFERFDYRVIYLGFIVRDDCRLWMLSRLSLHKSYFYILRLSNSVKSYIAYLHHLETTGERVDNFQKIQSIIADISINMDYDLHLLKRNAKMYKEASLVLDKTICCSYIVDIIFSYC